MQNCLNDSHKDYITNCSQFSYCLVLKDKTNSVHHHLINAYELTLQLSIRQNQIANTLL